MKRFLVGLFVLAFFLSGCEWTLDENSGTQIVLSDDGVTVDGTPVSSQPFRGVHCAGDVVFYRSGQGIAYGEGTVRDEHEQAEADAHTVVHITKPGRYVIRGTLSLGQIAVDLGEDAPKDPDAVVTLILNGVDLTCTVAPAVIFYNVYECGDEDAATKDVDTSKAGANVILADGSVNCVRGSYVAKIYRSCRLNEDGTRVLESTKLHKYDGAFYSRQSLNVNGGKKGDGVLNIEAENEGLDSELHLTLNGGTVNIRSGNDGINTNEDGVSVTTVNGGTLTVVCNGASGEGDGIDSNGWLVINGGTVNAQACATSMDAGIDSDKGIYLNGGKLTASGHMLDRIAGGNATCAVFRFAQRQEGKQSYALRDSQGNTVEELTPENAFTYLIVAREDWSPGQYSFWEGDTQLAFGGVGAGQGSPPLPQDGDSDGELPQKPEGEPPEGIAPPQPSDRTPSLVPPPEGTGQMPPGEFGQDQEAQAVFEIQKGANAFFSVRPLASQRSRA